MQRTHVSYLFYLHKEETEFSAITMQRTHVSYLFYLHRQRRDRVECEIERRTRVERVKLVARQSQSVDNALDELMLNVLRCQLTY